MLVYILFYIGLAALVGHLGRDRKFGFWGYLLASLLITPLFGFLLVLASDKKAVVAAAPATAS